MTNKHLSEQEIQLYALDKEGCGENLKTHVQSCHACRAEVQTYLQLFSAISEQPKPVFSFDLSGLVLQQLPETKTGFSLNSFMIPVLVLVALAVMGIPAYLFRKYLVSMFTGILPMTMYLILITAIGILLFQGVEMYRKYQKQLNALN
jgi:hypothetical protein